MAESGTEWIARFAAEAGADAPGDVEIEKLLRLASVAAHSSERIAAPIACWIAGSTGLDLDQAIALAERLGTADGD
jgi:Domain of unknown function (DUF6457)